MKNNDSLYDTKVVTIKDYLFYFLIIVAISFICIYFVRYNTIKLKEKTSVSYLVKNNYIENQVKGIQELKQVLNEKPSRLILYLSYHNSNKMYNTEKDIAKAFNDYDTKDITYIYDFTTLKEKVTNYKEILDDTLDINVTAFPVIIVYEDGQISSYKVVKKYNDLKNIFEKYKLEKNSR